MDVYVVYLQYNLADGMPSCCSVPFLSPQHNAFGSTLAMDGMLEVEKELGNLAPFMVCCFLRNAAVTMH